MATPLSGSMGYRRGTYQDPSVNRGMSPGEMLRSMQGTLDEMESRRRNNSYLPAPTAERPIMPAILGNAANAGETPAERRAAQAASGYRSQGGGFYSHRGSGGTILPKLGGGAYVPEVETPVQLAQTVRPNQNFVMGASISPSDFDRNGNLTDAAQGRVRENQLSAGRVALAARDRRNAERAARLSSAMGYQQGDGTPEGNLLAADDSGRVDLRAAMVTRNAMDRANTRRDNLAARSQGPDMLAMAAMQGNPAAMQMLAQRNQLNLAQFGMQNEQQLAQMRNQGLENVARLQGQNQMGVVNAQGKNELEIAKAKLAANEPLAKSQIDALKAEAEKNRFEISPEGIAARNQGRLIEQGIVPPEMQQQQRLATAQEAQDWKPGQPLPQTLAGLDPDSLARTASELGVPEATIRQMLLTIQPGTEGVSVTNPSGNSAIGNAMNFLFNPDSVPGLASPTYQLNPEDYANLPEWRQNQLRSPNNRPIPGPTEAAGMLWSRLMRPMQGGITRPQ